MGNTKSKNDELVVIGQPTGGLGNQLFVIATTYAYTRKHNKRFLLKEHWEDVSKDRPNYWNNILSFLKIGKYLVYDSQIKKIKDYVYLDVPYKEIPKFNHNILLKGYFQSEKYFKEYKNEICSLFKLPEYYDTLAGLRLAKFKEETIVAVHIRRGDYNLYEKYHLLSLDYYNRAKTLLEEKLGFRPIYLYFSNDIEWVKENFNLEDKDEIITEKKDYMEFAIMTKCHHFIIANSTFSWWSAYLSDTLDKILPKIVIAPEYWYKPVKIHDWSDIYPEGWIMVKDYNEGYFECSNIINSLNIESRYWRDDIIVSDDMSFKRFSNNDIGILYINNNINLIYNNKNIEILPKQNNLYHFENLQLQNTSNNIRSIFKSYVNKYDVYLINLESRKDRLSTFMKNTSSYNININHFNAVKHSKGSYGCALSHLSLIQYAKNNNLPYIIVMEDDSKIIIDNEKFISTLDILISNLDKWEIFNGAPSFWDKKDNIDSLLLMKSFSEELIETNWGQSTSFMIYNSNSYDKFLNYNFQLQIDQFISQNFTQNIYKNEPFSIQLSSYSDIGNINTTSEYENFFKNQYDIIKSKNIINKKSIGIYSIFIGKYEIFYKNFIENVEKHFYPGFTKYYYIVSDNPNLPKYNDRTFIFNTERIGWPYETLYRFKYMTMFNKEDIDKSDYIFFVNSNGKFINTISTEAISYDYSFTIHNGYINKKYKDITYEKKNSKSTAYIPYIKNYKYEYFAGGFYGARTDLYMEMCKNLDENINIDEKNNYIASWHDESHLNKFIMNLKEEKSNIFKVDISYHVPEESMKFFKYINLIYLDKKNYIQQSIDVKNLSDGNYNTSGKIIPNKYNKEFI